MAEHFRHTKYTQLNSDVFTSVAEFDWRHMVQEYGQFKQVEGRKDASIYEVLLTLRHCDRLVGCSSSREIMQPNLDACVLKRTEEVGVSTLNKDITNLRAFLCESCWPSRPLYGAGDIETIRGGNIHCDRNTIATRNRKAGKAMPERHVPEAIMTELVNRVTQLPDGQERLLSDRFSSQKWDRVRQRVKFPGLTLQVARKTLASLLAQRGLSTAVTQRLLEHSSPQLTNDLYTNGGSGAAAGGEPVADDGLVLIFIERLRGYG